MFKGVIRLAKYKCKVSYPVTSFILFEYVGFKFEWNIISKKNRGKNRSNLQADV